MSRTGKVMLWIAVCFLAGIGGGKMEYYHQHHNRKDIVIKHLETTARSITYKDVTVNATMTWFWVDTHSERLDFEDELGCINSKLHIALMKAIKHCESRNIPFSEKKDLMYFYTCIAKYFQEKDGPGPFYDGRDWVLLDISSIQFDGTCYVLDNDYGNIVNPY